MAELAYRFFISNPFRLVGAPGCLSDYLRPSAKTKKAFERLKDAHFKQEKLWHEMQNVSELYQLKILTNDNSAGKVIQMHVYNMQISS